MIIIKLFEKYFTNLFSKCLEAMCHVHLDSMSNQIQNYTRNSLYKFRKFYGWKIGLIYSCFKNKVFLQMNQGPLLPHLKHVNLSEIEKFEKPMLHHSLHMANGSSSLVFPALDQLIRQGETLNQHSDLTVRFGQFNSP